MPLCRNEVCWFIVIRGLIEVMQRNNWLLKRCAEHFLFCKSADKYLFHSGSTEVSVLYCCSVMQPVEAFLLLIASSPFGPQGATLTFRLKTHVSHITPTVSIHPSVQTVTLFNVKADSFHHLAVKPFPWKCWSMDATGVECDNDEVHLQRLYDYRWAGFCK